jgi:hypothetical protein
MKCSQFRDRIEDYMDCEMSEKQRRVMHDHAAACSECRSLVAKRERLFHCLNDSTDPNWDSALVDKVMEQIQSMPLPRPENPLYKPIMIAALTALLISGILIVIGYQSLPVGVTPVDMLKLFAGSIDMPSGLRASLNELWEFLGASWVVFRVMTQLVIQMGLIVLFQLPKAIPMVFLVSVCVLGFWWYRRQRKGNSLTGLLF